MNITLHVDTDVDMVDKEHSKYICVCIINYFSDLAIFINVTFTLVTSMYTHQKMKIEYHSPKGSMHVTSNGRVFSTKINRKTTLTKPFNSFIFPIYTQRNNAEILISLSLPSSLSSKFFRSHLLQWYLPYL